MGALYDHVTALAPPNHLLRVNELLHIMGNCWDTVQRFISNRTDEPTRTRYHTTQVENIKFENLLDVEKRATENRHSVVTEAELRHLREGRYDKLVEDQRVVDIQKDKELQQQEELLKQEEEAKYAARRQHSRKKKQGTESSVRGKTSAAHAPSWLTASTSRTAEGKAKGMLWSN